MAFWVYYDHLGRALLLNIAVVAIMFLNRYLTLHAQSTSQSATHSAQGDSLFHWFLASFVLGLVALFMLLGAVVAVVATVVKTWIEQSSTKVNARTLCGYGLRGAVLGLLQGVVFCMAISVAAFYFNVADGIPRPLALLMTGYGIAILILWFAAFGWGMSALVNRRKGIFDALRTAYVLVAGNLVFAFIIGAHLVALCLFSFLNPLVLIIFGVVPATVLAASSYEMLARKYAAPIENGQRILVFNDAEDDYLNRGFRDFFFPWKY